MAAVLSTTACSSRTLRTETDFSNIFIIQAKHARQTALLRLEADIIHQAPGQAQEDLQQESKRVGPPQPTRLNAQDQAPLLRLPGAGEEQPAHLRKQQDPEQAARDLVTDISACILDCGLALRPEEG